jgi:hypothetical protein
MRHSALQLRSIPVVFNLVNDTAQVPYPEWLLDICQWLHKRGRKVLSDLLGIDPAFESVAKRDQLVQNDWRTVRACTGLVNLMITK